MIDTPRSFIILCAVIFLCPSVPKIALSGVSFGFLKLPDYPITQLPNSYLRQSHLESPRSKILVSAGPVELVDRKLTIELVHLSRGQNPALVNRQVFHPAVQRACLRVKACISNAEWLIGCVAVADRAATVRRAGLGLFASVDVEMRRCRGSYSSIPGKCHLHPLARGYGARSRSNPHVGCALFHCEPEGAAAVPAKYKSGINAVAIVLFRHTACCQCGHIHFGQDRYFVVGQLVEV